MTMLGIYDILCDIAIMTCMSSSYHCADFCGHVVCLYMFTHFPNQNEFR